MFGRKSDYSKAEFVVGVRCDGSPEVCVHLVPGRTPARRGVGSRTKTGTKKQVKK